MTGKLGSLSYLGHVRGVFGWHRPGGGDSLRFVAYVVRCSGAAALAYALALAVGLPDSVWAPVSALVVMQERTDDTRKSLLWRILGTISGAVAAVGVSEAGSPLGGDMVAQLAAAVAICAVVVRLQPLLRVSMWTATIVLLDGLPGEPTTSVAAARATEVILGALVAGALHWSMDAVLLRLPATLWGRPRGDAHPPRGAHAATLLANDVGADD